MTEPAPPPPPDLPTPRCFNCRTTDGVHHYSFDMDLPTITACKICLLGVTLNDDALLKAMRPRTTKPRKAKHA